MSPSKGQTEYTRDTDREVEAEQRALSRAVTQTHSFKQPAPFEDDPGSVCVIDAVVEFRRRDDALASARAPVGVSESPRQPG
jgi:hypothetical protein